MYGDDHGRYMARQPPSGPPTYADGGYYTAHYGWSPWTRAPRSHYALQLEPYVGNRASFRCPADKGFANRGDTPPAISYHWKLQLYRNPSLWRGAAPSQFVHPDKTMLLHEQRAFHKKTMDNGSGYALYTGNWDANPGQSMMVGAADGHVAFLRNSPGEMYCYRDPHWGYSIRNGRIQRGDLK